MTSVVLEADNASLAGTSLFDIDHPEIRSGVAKVLQGGPGDDKTKAVAFYYAVRDGISYQVFGTGLRDDDLRGSAIMRSKRGFCLHKAILFATLCRAEGIPCRISAARVTNHVSSPNLAKLVGGDVFLHWFNQVWLDGRWLNVAPIFGRLLCQMYRIPPLEFDGTGDAFVQGHVVGASMKYLEPPKHFETPTSEELIAAVAAVHPLMITKSRIVPKEREIAAL